MLDVEFRIALKKELPRIVELKVAMFRDVGTSKILSEDVFDSILKDYREHYDRDEAVHFVAVCDSTIIAMVGAFVKSDLPYSYFQPPFYGFIGDVYTEPNYRGQGLAHQLNEMAVDWLKSRGVAMIKLLTSAEGRSIYEKMGFKSWCCVNEQFYRKDPPAMLDVEIIDPTEVESAAAIFHRDGFVPIKDALNPEQLAYAQSGAARVIAEQMRDIPLEEANRGYARYSFGPQLHHPEWAQLIDLPTILPIIEAIWGSSDYICSGGGGDYSTPGAKEQHLHADIRDVFNDPLGLVTIHDVPTPYIVVNFLMVEFKKINGAIRFVPGTHRTRQPVPTMEEEPDRMKQSIICAPAGTALIRDVRCWHGGTANNSDEIRPMTSVGYFAPWFRLPNLDPSLPRPLYETLSPRGKELARLIVQPD